MNEKDSEQIDILKNITRALQEFANFSGNIINGYLLPEDKHQEIIKTYIDKFTSQNEKIINIKEKILNYDTANTDDKLRTIYDELDAIQAEYTAESISNTKVEETEPEDEIEKHISMLCSKGMHKDNIKIISSLMDYVDFVHELDLGYLSRGQENCDWPLLPSALRTEKSGGRIYSDTDIQEMVNEFHKTLAYYDKSYSNSKNELEIMAYAQHFSIPTNLIDFTESHLISLLFALEKYKSDFCGIVYFVDAKNFNAQKCGKNTIPNCSDQKELCDGGASSIFIKSDNVNERIHFQKGYFLKTPNNYDKADVITEIKDFCKVVLIPSDSKYDVLQDLFKLGLGFQSIYPDLDNMAKTIKFKNRMMHEV